VTGRADAGAPVADLHAVADHAALDERFQERLGPIASEDASDDASEGSGEGTGVGVDLRPERNANRLRILEYGVDGRRVAKEVGLPRRFASVDRARGGALLDATSRTGPIRSDTIGSSA
jgi:hypothetical protein